MTHLGGVRLLCSSIVLLCAFTTGCGSSSTTLLSPTGLGQRCALTLNVNTSNIGAAGGSGTVSIAIARECEWTAKAESGWLTLTGPATGQGPADLAFSVQPNRSTSPRTSGISVGDQRVTISQQAATCPWKVSPTEVPIGPAGGDRTVTLSTEDFCSWSVTSREPWVIVVSGSNGTGNGQILLRITANVGAERTAIVDVPGGTVTVRQQAAPPPPAVPGPAPAPPAPPPPPPSDPPPDPIPDPTPAPDPAPPPPPPPAPCTFTAAPTGFSDVVFSGGSLQLDVTTQAGCTWTATSGTTWVTVSTGTGTGSGRVQLTVAENTGAARSATLVIAGQTVTVSQQARPPCTFTVAPTEFNDVLTSGGSLRVDVTTQAGCAWSAVANVPWLTISSGTSGTGTGFVQFNVAEHTGAARSGTLTVAGQSVTVNQQGQPAPCAYTISPTSYTPLSTGGTVSVAVTTTAGCQWTVAGSPAWVTASPASGTGSGTTTITVASNSGAERSATFTIAGRDFIVSQGAAPCTYAAGPTTRTVPYTRSTREIGVITQSHCPVSATESASWFSIYEAPTFGSGEIVIRIDENTSSEPRSAPLTITGQGFTHTVTIIQEGKP